MRILMLDDRAPHPWLGAGYPRAHQVIETLCDLGHKLWLLPCVFKETQREARKSLPEACKYIPQNSGKAIIHYVEQHAHRFDAIWISRPHNMALLSRYLPDHHPVWQQYPLVIYDAEAIFALRSEKTRQYYPDFPPGRTLPAELSLADVANAVVVVNEQEGHYFKRRGNKTFKVAATCSSRATDTAFSERQGFLFVGSLRAHPEPNSDAITWFCQEVLPLIREKLGDQTLVSVAGDVSPDIRERLQAEDVRVLGRVEDLSAAYRDHRVFIAPHRFAAGVPHKILEATEFGIPCVSTLLLAEQLDWQDGVQTRAAETGSARAFADACLELYQDEAIWTAVRGNAINAVREEYSVEAFRSALTAVLRT